MVVVFRHRGQNLVGSSVQTQRTNPRWQWCSDRGQNLDSSGVQTQRTKPRWQWCSDTEDKT